jgi:hypothetical protein
MIDAFIRATLGPWGTAVLDFYISNSLWINGLILLYAFLVVLARRTFELGRHTLIASLRSSYDSQFEKKEPSAVLKVLEKINIPWDQALGSSYFPFVTPPGSIWIYPKSLVTIQKLLSLEQLAERLVKP